MKKTIFILSCIFAVSFLAGCSSNKSALADWMRNLDEQQLAVYFWCNDFDKEKSLTDDEVQELVSIINSLKEDKLTENKHLAGITPEYGFHLLAGDEKYYINQANAPNGQTEIGFQDKLWWIKSSDLHDYMRSFLTVNEE